MEEKIAIVENMVKNGYHLFDETVEHFANRWPIELLEEWNEKFAAYVENK